MIKCISFDVDGTLVAQDIDKAVWNEWIPCLYAQKNGLALSTAQKIVLADYEQQLQKIEERWTDLDFWLARYGLEERRSFLLEEVRRGTRPFDDVRGTLVHDQETFPGMVRCSS